MYADALSAPSMIERTTSLHEIRLEHSFQQIRASGARRVLDLGCGSGQLLYRLLGDRQFVRIVGLDTCARALFQTRALLADHLREPASRLELINGSYSEPQPTLGNFDAVAMVETIEHLKPGALSAAERVVFAQIRPRVLYLTTPNREYNPLFGLRPGEFREQTHEFEWDRAKFRHWVQGVARRNGYRVTLGGIGDDDPELGQPTQTAFFSRVDSGPMRPMGSGP